MTRLRILITGASGGIGARTAVQLAQSTSTYKVEAIALHYNSNSAKLQEIQVEIKSLDPSIKVISIQADLASSEEVSRLHSETIRQMGTINVLFANAGTTSDASGPTGQLENVSLETFEKTWRVNTLSSYHLTQLVVPSMLEEGFGRVIYNSSVAALTGGVVGPHYASSKSALHGMLHFLASKYAKDGITFNAVAPALIEDTTMLPKGGEELKAKVPVGRLGRPDEIASVVDLMSSRKLSENM
ncbi:putative 3-oxoacyl-[acyl-carrier-protein] reductase FabG [Glarea lozoyensis 74030]|uniref:Putative 3-oxoacyl-[acyl-carrier-protein] reductase FabG n=1 Tax=Glarea lozoyensis (strain ATCC 74030 / MF5533) TaxID=1104152 RepID=H0EHR6_GLAL7|nr:putative 3-oxoacyl-[acyl-carrier-protein] reductase FabG [Glarea lozoyensis 74030]